MKTPPSNISLRPVRHTDIPALFDMQLDPEANRLAGTKPRDRATFQVIWDRILGDASTAPDPAVVPRAILADDALVGIINIFPRNDSTYLGYWIHQSHWGRGIATRAIALLMAEYAARPIHAQVAAHNTASQRALQRNGFVITSRELGEDTDRYTANEVLNLTLT